MPLETLTRKRTFDSTAAYESDAEEGCPSSRTRRQRTSSTTSVESTRPARGLSANISSTPHPRILKPTTSSNTRQAVKRATSVATISKPEPPLPTGIPRSVAFRAKRATLATTGENATKQALAPPSKPLPLSTATKGVPAPPRVFSKPSKENVQVADNARNPVSHPVMEPSKSGHSEASSKRRTNSFSKVPLEDLISGTHRPLPVAQLPPPPSFARSSISRANLDLAAPTRAQQPSAAQPESNTNPRSASRTVAQRESVPQPGTTVYTDSYGCVHLAPTDCELFVSFSHSTYYEVWDVLDDSHISCPAYLYIMAKEPSKWDGTPLSTPDVTLIDIECRTKPGSSRFCDRPSALDRWQCRFEGVELPTTTGNVGDNVPSGTVSVERKWDRIYSMPLVGKAFEDAHSVERVAIPQAVSTHARNASSNGGLASILFSGLNDNEGSKLDPDGAFSKGSHVESATAKVVRQIPGRGWCMKFWVPVPAYLFLKKETRVFEIEAKVHIVPGGMDGVGMADYGFLTSRTEMTVSHLRSEREMDFFVD